MKVISTPRITTLNNQKAVVRIVTEEVFYDAQVEPPVVTDGVSTEPVIAYSANVIPVGFVLDVTPQVGLDEVITLNVHPTVTDIVRVETSPNEDSAPVLSVRELDTVGKVQRRRDAGDRRLRHPRHQRPAGGPALPQGPAAARPPLPPHGDEGGARPRWSCCSRR